MYTIVHVPCTLVRNVFQTKVLSAKGAKSGRNDRPAIQTTSGDLKGQNNNDQKRRRRFQHDLEDKGVNPVTIDGRPSIQLSLLDFLAEIFCSKSLLSPFIAGGGRCHRHLTVPSTEYISSILAHLSWWHSYTQLWWLVHLGR